MTGSTGASRLRFAQFAGYGAGDAANNLTFAMALNLPQLAGHL